MKGKIISKLSVKTIIGSKPDAPAKGDNEVHWLANMAGNAISFTTGKSEKGDWCKLHGQFVGVNLETGEVLRAGECFLPLVAEKLVVPALKQNPNKSVQFGFKIGVQRDEQAATNYVYVAEPIADVAGHDPLQPLLEKMQLTTPALDNKKEPTKSAAKR